MKVSTLLILLLIFSCKRPGYKDNPDAEATYISEKTQIFNKDSSRVLMNYNESKVMLDSLSYNKEGNLHGLQMTFDAVTKVKQYYTYVKGEKTGEMLSYYPSGSLEYKADLFKGLNYGVNIFYYENGIIQSYECKDSEERLVYQRDYDTSGQIIKSEGFLAYYYGLNSDTINLNDSLYFHIIMGRPPNSNVNLYIGDLLSYFAQYTNEKYPRYIELAKDTGGNYRKVFIEITDTISGHKEQIIDTVFTYVKAQ